MKKIIFLFVVVVLFCSVIFFSVELVYIDQVRLYDIVVDVLVEWIEQDICKLVGFGICYILFDIKLDMCGIGVVC